MPVSHVNFSMRIISSIRQVTYIFYNFLDASVIILLGTNVSNSSFGMPPEKTRFALVAIAASAGGLSAIREILSELPAAFGAAVVVVQHLNPNYQSMLASILSRQTALRVKEAEDGDVLSAGTVYVAPPNHHLVVQQDGTLSLTQSARVHFARPSADILLESVANEFRERAIAIILTGSGSDGADGVKAIKKMGGIVIVQSPETAEFPSMPEAAIQTGNADMVLPLNQIAPALTRLVVRTSPMKDGSG